MVPCQLLVFCTSEDGHSVGEIALIKEDCIRTASVVVNTETDLMVVDRALYNRSVKEVLEKEFNEKTEFVETNPLFLHWTPRLKKSLAIALKKEAFLYGCPLTKQGQSLNCAYFIRRWVWVTCHVVYTGINILIQLVIHRYKLQFVLTDK